MYATTCPRCGAEDQLEVVAGCFTATGMPLCPDGFAFVDARQIHTWKQTFQRLTGFAPSAQKEDVPW
ncbi:protein of unknown function [Candidatus Hydrogenisulfobacillus filiaventi]|uniref:Uncharacterized protein n=1 Tax=Candidatus Hydrogenisulfobacillus filiaventi TaxID=2707344 RepID=A0A6F8ZIF7_9FIRM|nr:protein of unknown function [Candidatus Hydrogenisulfobacillus filiaventi]